MNHSSRSALITGASSGIGAAFARRLAADGYHLILVARREQKLQALAQELQERYPHTPVADVLVADLAKVVEVERVEAHIRSINRLELLINNAGFGTSGKFAEIDLNKQLDMVHVHINATMRLTRAALPAMITHQKGFIINVSSIAAYLSNPENVTYCATKAYLNRFSESLQLELNEHGVQVQALCPGFTYSEFHDTPEYKSFTRDQIPKQLWMSAEELVEQSLAALENKQVIFIPGWRNRWIVAALNPVTQPVIRAIRQFFRKK